VDLLDPNARVAAANAFLERRDERIRLSSVTLSELDRIAYRARLLRHVGLLRTLRNDSMSTRRARGPTRRCRTFP
jgi:hypothetical protein